MKKCHRILCIVLALVLAAGLLPAAASAADTGSGHLIINRLSNITTSSDVTTADGIFSINYYFTPAAATDTVTFYYWTAQDYAAADVLTAENATGTAAMTLQPNGSYWTAITGIAAKELDHDVFVCGVYEQDGQTCSTGVIVYSLGYYCVNKAANGTEAFKPLAEATVVYSYYAKQYFA